jgi:hypothetical protein
VITTPASGRRSAVREMLRFHTDRLVAWVERNGWAGWDPYDVWDHRIGLWASEHRTLPQRVAGALLGRIEERFPAGLRHAVGARRQVNAKAMGLFAAAFLDLERLEGAPRRFGPAPAGDACFDWLDANRVHCGGGVGWGYPFDWRSRVLIPRNTPTAVTSAFVGHAYWLRYLRQGDAAALARCEEICRFILGGLNRSDPEPDGSFCFSYTPVDRFQVHNANLLAAEFLVRIGRETGREDWLRTGVDAGRFALRELRPDGTLPYWSVAQSRGLEQDLYHSGFEIRMLDGIARATARVEFRAAADRYFETWLGMFFAADGTPTFVSGRPDVVEVHSCAEALLCAAALAGRPGLPRAELPGHVSRSLEAAIRHLWVATDAGSGYFAWTSRRRYGRRVRTTIPLIRWGQAWMLRAMAAAALALREES